MPSLLPGFEYDIFISYRHNDNKSGWVTEFVRALEEELAATVKEPLTIYFDKNPHDGLLETHHVDKSLEGKLKCLIFIPIISQTYCDPKSFAWIHEFVAFNKSSQEDQYGKNIKLSNGNVASRILPVRIHELDPEDKHLLETETGGALRAIEFIFKSPGVNRPLTAADKREDNVGKTFYKDQLNKVANAVKEIITAIKNPAPPKSSIETSALPAGARKPHVIKRFAIAASLFACVFIVGYFLYRRFVVPEPNEVLDKSVAVLPFVNMSNDPDQEYFSDGISEEILNLLAKVPELKVIGRTSSFYFKGKNEDLRIIGEKLGASYVLEGSLRKDGNLIRITAQLIRASDGTHLWSETFERKLENIFQLQDEIASNVLAQLKLKLLAEPQKKAISQEVYNLILKGRYFVDRGNYAKGLGFYEQALALDSTQAIVWASLAQARVIAGVTDFKQYEKNLRLAIHDAGKAISIDDTFSQGHRALSMVYIFYEFDFNRARRELNIASQLDPNNPDGYRDLGVLEDCLGDFDAALVAASKSVELNPLSTPSLSSLANVYTSRLEFEKAEKILKQSLEISSLLERQLVNVYILWGKIDQAENLFNETFDHWDPQDREISKSMMIYASGEPTVALENLKTLLKTYNGNSQRVAEAFAFMDQPDDAFVWLSKAYEERFRMHTLKRSVPFMKYHSDPRYIAMLKKMNLPI
ncbi:MAG TPA: hypothetical protein VG737_17010 [Cyclobacteriaceae bacterium]|nr:hypothetical protein [Cyclobacteriaceae bacterium]